MSLAFKTALQHPTQQILTSSFGSKSDHATRLRQHMQQIDVCCTHPASLLYPAGVTVVPSQHSYMCRSWRLQHLHCSAAVLGSTHSGACNSAQAW